VLYKNCLKAVFLKSATACFYNVFAAMTPNAKLRSLTTIAKKSQTIQKALKGSAI